MKGIASRHEIADGADDDLWFNFIEWLAVASYISYTIRTPESFSFH